MHSMDLLCEAIGHEEASDFCRLGIFIDAHWHGVQAELERRGQQLVSVLCRDVAAVSWAVGPPVVEVRPFTDFADNVTVDAIVLSCFGDVSIKDRWQLVQLAIRLTEKPDWHDATAIVWDDSPDFVADFLQFEDEAGDEAVEMAALRQPGEEADERPAFPFEFCFRRGRLLPLPSGGSIERALFLAGTLQWTLAAPERYSQLLQHRLAALRAATVPGSSDPFAALVGTQAVPAILPRRVADLLLRFPFLAWAAIEAYCTESEQLTSQPLQLTVPRSLTRAGIEAVPLEFADSMALGSFCKVTVPVSALQARKLQGCKPRKLPARFLTRFWPDAEIIITEDGDCAPAVPESVITTEAKLNGGRICAGLRLLVQSKQLESVRILLWGLLWSELGRFQLGEAISPAWADLALAWGHVLEVGCEAVPVWVAGLALLKDACELDPYTVVCIAARLQQASGQARLPKPLTNSCHGVELIPSAAYQLMLDWATGYRSDALKTILQSVDEADSVAAMNRELEEIFAIDEEKSTTAASTQLRPLSGGGEIQKTLESELRAMGLEELIPVMKTSPMRTERTARAPQQLFSGKSTFKREIFQGPTERSAVMAEPSAAEQLQQAAKLDSRIGAAHVLLAQALSSRCINE